MAAFLQEQREQRLLAAAAASSSNSSSSWSPRARQAHQLLLMTPDCCGQ
jgi:hypothetical protein